MLCASDTENFNRERFQEKKNISESEEDFRTTRRGDYHYPSVDEGKALNKDDILRGNMGVAFIPRTVRQP